MLFGALSDHPPMTATEALYAAVRAVPEGQVTATAKRAGIKDTQFSRLRQGKNLNIGITTLAKLARAMGKSADELIGLTKPDPGAITGSVHVSGDAAAKVRKKLARIAADVNALVGSMPEGAEQKKPRS